MKVLFENLILAATLSALNASTNYPVDNLKDPALKKRFQSLGATDTVTVMFRPNLMDRGDCESATPPAVTGEVTAFTSNATWGRTADAATGWPHSGTFSYELIKTVAAGTTGYADFTDSDTLFHGLIPGHSYFLGAWIYIPTQAGLTPNTMLSLQIGDGVGGMAINAYCQAIFDTPQYVIATGVLGLAATKAIPRVIFGATAPNNAYCYVDDITLYDDLVGSLKTINCVHYGFTNATGIVIILKDLIGTTLKTITITTPEETGAHHFEPVADVCSIDIQLTGPTGVYLGGFGAGMEVTFPDPLADWNEPKQDNSSSSGTPDGQYNQTYVKPLRLHSWTFRELTRDEATALSDAYVAIGIGKQVWADPFEGNHSFIKPLYCVLTEPIQPAKNGRMYSITLSIAEAR